MSAACKVLTSPITARQHVVAIAKPSCVRFGVPCRPRETRFRAAKPAAVKAVRQMNGKSAAVRSTTTCSSEEVSTAELGRATYRPESFDVLVDDAVKCIQAGLQDGTKRMEVEYPLSSDTSGYKDASDSFIDANIALAISAAKRISASSDLKICVLVPDGPELERASKRFAPALELAGENVTLGCMAGKKKGAFKGFFSGAVGSGELVEDYNDNDIFICVNASTVELPTVRKYTEEVVKDRVMILWCLELDTLRADLGLFGFPGKELQYEFLSEFKSMFYIRQRGYSKSVEVAPFVVNYNGALFREYPGPWQAMIKQDNGELACIAERDTRYDLGELKEELLEVMGLNTEEKGSTAAFLRRGYKTSTWWEEDKDSETSKNWRL